MHCFPIFHRFGAYFQLQYLLRLDKLYLGRCFLYQTEGNFIPEGALNFLSQPRLNLETFLEHTHCLQKQKLLAPSPGLVILIIGAV